MAGPGDAPAAAAAGAGDAPLPALFEMTAPADWRAIDFVSDLHLCEALPRTAAAFAAYLRTTPADLVVILGDLFELWVGDEMAGQPFESDLVATLAEASARCGLAFMVGNRDFLAGERLAHAAGWRVLPDPTVLDAWGRRVLLSHGDALCLDDRPYQAFRAEVRSARWQQQFLAQSLAERLRIAAGIRQASQQRRLMGGDIDGNGEADLDRAETLRWLHAADSGVLVHGHTHRPGSEVLAPGFERHVLSDWDLDAGARAEVLRLTRGGFQRLTPSH